MVGPYHYAGGLGRVVYALAASSGSSGNGNWIKCTINARVVCPDVKRPSVRLQNREELHDVRGREVRVMPANRKLHKIPGGGPFWDHVLRGAIDDGSHSTGLPCGIHKFRNWRAGGDCICSKLVTVVSLVDDYSRHRVKAGSAH